MHHYRYHGSIRNLKIDHAPLEQPGFVWVKVRLLFRVQLAIWGSSSYLLEGRNIPAMDVLQSAGGSLELSVMQALGARNMPKCCLPMFVEADQVHEVREEKVKQFSVALRCSGARRPVNSRQGNLSGSLREAPLQTISAWYGAPARWAILFSSTLLFFNIFFHLDWS